MQRKFSKRLLQRADDNIWPELNYENWKDTCETLQLWTQIVGKVKLALTPFLNEWWEVGFDVSARGLSTGFIPTGNRAFEVIFDFISYRLLINVSDGRRKSIRLYSRSVADFYSEFFSALRSLGINVTIRPQPAEIVGAIPLDKDIVHDSYNGLYVQQWWKILVQTTRVLQIYRSSFFGKSSPLLFYWGSFDLGTSRFSGRPAPLPTFGPKFYRIGEDQENVGCGFWPGNANSRGFTYGKPAFYSYTYPAPPGFSNAPVKPSDAYFDNDMSEFILPYDAVRKSSSPDQMLLEFLESTYNAGALLNHWDSNYLRGKHA